MRKWWKRSSRKITSRQENSSSKKKPTTHRKLLPFVTQFQPSLPCTKNKLMDQWHLIQDQPSLRGIFKQPPLSLIETENRLKTCLLKQKFFKRLWTTQWLHSRSRAGLSQHDCKQRRYYYNKVLITPSFLEARGFAARVLRFRVQ